MEKLSAVNSAPLSETSASSSFFTSQLSAIWKSEYSSPWSFVSSGRMICTCTDESSEGSISLPSLSLNEISTATASSISISNISAASIAVSAEISVTDISVPSGKAVLSAEAITSIPDSEDPLNCTASDVLSERCSSSETEQVTVSDMAAKKADTRFRCFFCSFTFLT